MAKTSLLVVDDDFGVLQTVTDIVRNIFPETEISFARNGQEALDLLPLLPVPTVILTDVQMPVMDGPTFVKELRRRGNKTPVIAMTGIVAFDRKSMPGIMRLLPKPFKMDDLGDALAPWLDPNLNLSG